MGEAMFNLLSLYYVFDRNYPAVYGVLLLLERYCLCKKDLVLQEEKATHPAGEKKFTNNFESFLVSIPKQTVWLLLIASVFIFKQWKKSMICFQLKYVKHEISMFCSIYK